MIDDCELLSLAEAVAARRRLWAKAIAAKRQLRAIVVAERRRVEAGGAGLIRNIVTAATTVVKV